MNTGQAIKTVRQKKLVKQKDLAELLEISSSFLSQIEHGKREPSPELIEKIADALRIPVQLILLLSTEFKLADAKFERQLKDISFAMLEILSAV